MTHAKPILKGNLADLMHAESRAKLRAPAPARYRVERQCLSARLGGPVRWVPVQDFATQDEAKALITIARGTGYYRIVTI